MQESTLIAAVRSNDLALVQRLLLDETTASTSSTAMVDALCCAARLNHCAVLAALCARAPHCVHSPDRDGVEALLHAVTHRQLGAARVLLDAGADANARTRDLRTALTVAASNDDRDMAALLLECGANVSVFATADKDDVLGTHLMQACLSGSLACAALFVAAGQDPNAPNSTGSTPLMALVATGNFDAVKCLVGAGAACDRFDARDGSPLIVAASRGFALIAAFLATMHAGSLRRADLHGRTPLMHAAAAGHAATVVCLVDRGAQLDVTDRSGFTALMLAAQRGHTDVVRALLAAGASATVAIKLNVFKKINALTLAKTGGHVDIVALLQQAIRGAKKRQPQSSKED
jgi:ankyrin repeat protein